ncbi:hypothetical protein F5148DRAFT_1268178 [Russula earlei]|uniref:Uncharacterized protein n=1 Tax=Russula earlei TaxID=71964 RepID=A0ACC0TTA0_9AGAM|nr:hypothetical protein F5148DRAFT_1268178 [Russula earlei]
MMEECEREEDLMEEDMIARAIAMSMHPEAESDMRGMWKVSRTIVHHLISSALIGHPSLDQQRKFDGHDVCGEMLDLKETVNGMMESLSVFADEVTRVARKIGTEGRLGGQANLTNVSGLWKDLTDCVNVMAANNMTMLSQTAMARGVLTQKVTGVSVSGEILHLVNTINDMIDQLEFFAFGGLCRPHGCDVGTEGKLGVQAEVSNVQNLARNHVGHSLASNVSQHDGRQFDHPSG